MLRSPNELHEVIAREGRVAPHADPVLKRKPQCYARLVRDMSLRGLVSFGAPSEATVGVFVVPKKLGKQRLIFDTRRVNQHFRRPWYCVLPTPASWAGLQLPVDSACHMAQTDVNTAFYRILAPTGMSEYFILPRVSTHLLLRERVEAPDHLRHLSDVSPQLQVLAMGFSWAGLFLSKDGGELYVRASGFSPDTLLMDRHQAPAMTRDSICFGVYVDGVCAVGCDRPKVLAAMEVMKALDATGLQCSEIEADTSRQVFTGLRLDHESGILSLEDSRIWRLRHVWSLLRAKSSLFLVTRWLN